MFSNKLKWSICFTAICLSGVSASWGRSPQSDMNGDYRVDAVDFSLFIGHWITNHTEADFDGNGRVTLNDFRYFQDSWMRSYSPLVINEVLASNNTVAADPWGEYSDFIEIYNPSNTSIDIGGMYLSDNKDVLDKWAFPTGTVIDPNSYLMIWADSDYGKPGGRVMTEEQNVALNGTASASSIGYEWLPEYAIDDASETGYHSVQDAALHWFEVDLGEEFTLSRIELLNRAKYLQRLNGAVIMALNNHRETVFQSEPVAGSPLTVIEDNDGLGIERVRYLRVEKDSAAGNPLTIMELRAIVTTEIPVEGLFADFGIKSSGDDIYLTDRDGVSVLDSLVFKDLPSDISYGRLPNGGERTLMMKPSPAQANTIGYVLQVKDTQFSHDRGFYDTPFNLTISCLTEGAEIYYTMDGSEPDTHATLYTGPITINKTTCVRAAAFKTGWLGTNIDTQTYIFLNDVIHSEVMDTAITENSEYGPQMQAALTDLPTVSLVTTPGILEPYYPGPGPYPEGVYDEYPVSVEWILPDGTQGFQENCGISRYGGHWYDKPNSYRPFDKWSFRLYFRDRYGATKLHYPLFEGFDHGRKPVDVFDQLELRSGSHDMSQRGFYMSGRLTDDTMMEMGNISPHGRFVHVYINGTYWGQYNLHERWNADMHAQYLGGEKEDYESIKTHVNQGGWSDMGEPYDGDGSTWERVLANRGNYEAVRTDLDVPNYIDFMLLWMFGLAEPEFRSVGPVEAGGGYKFWLNDPDGYTRSVSSQSNYDGPGQIFKYLNMQGHPDYMILLADRIHTHLFNSGALTPAKMRQRLLGRCDEIQRAFLAESARWGYLSPTEWADKRDSYVNGVLPTRTGALFSFLKSKGLYPNLDAPVFNIDGIESYGGEAVGGEMLTLSCTGETIWSSLMPTTGTVQVYFPEDNQLGLSWTQLGYTPNSQWITAVNGIGYEKKSGYEDMIHTDVSTQMATHNSAFVRIEFDLDDPEDVKTLSLKILYDDGFIAYINGIEAARSSNITSSVPGQTVLNTNHEASSQPETFDISAYKEYLTAGKNVLAIHGINYKTTSSDFIIQAWLEGGVTSSSDVYYCEDGSDPRLPGGEISPAAKLYSEAIELLRSTHITARAYHQGQWSALSDATWSVGPIRHALRVSELMYHPAGDPNSEFIELFNTGPETINLNLAHFTSGIQYQFDDCQLASGEYLVLVSDEGAFRSTYPEYTGTIAGHYDGRLDNGGERLTLVDALSNVVFDFAYRDDWYTQTDGEGYSLVPVDKTAGSYDEKTDWMAGTTLGGTPGNAEPSLFP